jgi:hypothetical protein
MTLMNPEPKTTFTASGIAAILGITPRRIRSVLEGVDPDAVQVVKGNRADAWSWDSLPENLRRRLDEEAERRGYRDGHQLLSDPAREWKPHRPFAHCSNEARAIALNLKDSQARALKYWETNKKIDSQLKQMLVDDYTRVFKKRVSERHAINLFFRTLSRAGTAESFEDESNYLPERPAAAPVPKPEIKLGQVHAEQFEIIIVGRDAGDGYEAIWLRAVEIYASDPSKEMKRALLEFLWAKLTGIAASEDAFRKQFERRVSAWMDADFDPAALADGRKERKGIATKAPYQQAALDFVNVYAGKNCGARLAQGLREAVDKGLVTDPRIIEARKAALKSGKSYIRRSLRNALKGHARFYKDLDRGRERTVPLELDYSGIYSMDCIVGDDFTWPILFRVPDGNGWWRLIRGQDILVSDFRSLRILGAAFRPEEQYNALTIRSIFVRICEQHGIPKMLLREGGMWRSAKLINGLASPISGNRALSEARMRHELARRGIQWRDIKEGMIQDLSGLRIKFREAFKAQAKPIERVGGLLQDLMEGLAGYCGRNERIDCPAETKRWQLELARHNPKALEHFYDFDQWEAMRAKLIGQFNSTVQEGRRLKHPKTGEPLSPEQMFEACWNHGDEPKRVDAWCRWIMSHQRINDITVAASGAIAFRIGKELFRYCDEVSGQHIGERVIGWLDPETPEHCTFTDENMRNPFTAQRLNRVGALTIDERFKAESAKVHAHQSGLKTKFRVITASFDQVFRRNVATAETLQLGQHIEKEGARLDRARAAENSRAAAINKEVRELRELGVPISASAVANDERELSALKGLAKSLKALEQQKEEGI